MVRSIYPTGYTEYGWGLSTEWLLLSVSPPSYLLSGGGQLYMWGKLKNTGDDWMYPKPLMDLRLYFIPWFG